jgi:hypothetical protein
MANETNSKMAQLIDRAMSDKTFKTQLIENPVATLKDAGIEVPEGLKIKVMENTEKVFHLVLPQNISELSEDDLSNVVGGGGSGIIDVNPWADE